MEKITFRQLLGAMPTHMAMGAFLGLLTFFILYATDNGNLNEMIASGTDPKRTALVLAAVFAAMFALPCGITGLLFMAIEAGRD